MFVTGLKGWNVKGIKNSDYFLLMIGNW